MLVAFKRKSLPFLAVRSIAERVTTEEKEMSPERIRGTERRDSSRESFDIGSFTRSVGEVWPLASTGRTNSTVGSTYDRGS